MDEANPHGMDRPRLARKSGGMYPGSGGKRLMSGIHQRIRNAYAKPVLPDTSSPRNLRELNEFSEPDPAGAIDRFPSSQTEREWDATPTDGGLRGSPRSMEGSKPTFLPTSSPKVKW